MVTKGLTARSSTAEHENTHVMFRPGFVVRPYNMKHACKYITFAAISLSTGSAKNSSGRQFAASASPQRIPSYSENAKQPKPAAIYSIMKIYNAPSWVMSVPIRKRVVPVYHLLNPMHADLDRLK